MARTLQIEQESFPIAGSFTISRGSKTAADVICVTLRQGGKAGRGECVPYGRYGETLAGVRDTIEAARVVIELGGGRADLLGLMPAGAARNAVDCALWDLEAKMSGVRAADRLGATHTSPLVTAYTLSLAAPEEMERAGGARRLPPAGAEDQGRRRRRRRGPHPRGGVGRAQQPDHPRRQ